MTHRFTNPSGGTTQKLKKQTLTRDNHQCRSCGNTTGPFEIDHINNTRGPNYNTLQNLQTLCKPCHWQKTRKEAQKGHQQRKQRAKYPKEQHPGLKTA